MKEATDCRVLLFEKETNEAERHMQDAVWSLGFRVTVDYPHAPVLVVLYWEYLSLGWWEVGPFPAKCMFPRVLHALLGVLTAVYRREREYRQLIGNSTLLSSFLVLPKPQKYAT